MEGCCVGYVARGQAAGEIGYFVGERVPCAVEFFVGRVRGRGDAVALFDKGVEVDHLDVVVEEGDCCVAGEAQGEGGDGGEDASFRHFWWFLFLVVLQRKGGCIILKARGKIVSL